jgi:anti-sigma regulatory factor (Ser/Thr protein kinase)
MTTRTPAGVYAELAATRLAARQARALLRDALGADHPLAHDAALAISELVSNSVLHSRSGQPGGTITIAIDTAARHDVRIEVRDAGSPGAPVVRARRDGEHGRGLQIIDAIAAGWGTRATSTGRST